MRHRIEGGPSPRLVSDMELYVLAKAGVVSLTKTELDSLPIETVQHFIGFAEGQRALEEEARKKQEKDSQFKKFSMGMR